jgi:hypothetical protein
MRCIPGVPYTGRLAEESLDLAEKGCGVRSDDLGTVGPKAEKVFGQMTQPTRCTAICATGKPLQAGQTPRSLQEKPTTRCVLQPRQRAKPKQSMPQRKKIPKLLFAAPRPTSATLRNRKMTSSKLFRH